MCMLISNVDITTPVEAPTSTGVLSFEATLGRLGCLVYARARYEQMDACLL